MRREEHIALDTDHQHRLDRERAKSGGETAAMLGKIEAIHCAGQIQVAIGIENACEALGLRLQVTLDREARREWTDLAGDTGERLAPEVAASGRPA